MTHFVFRPEDPAHLRTLRDALFKLQVQGMMSGDAVDDDALWQLCCQALSANSYRAGGLMAALESDLTPAAWMSRVRKAVKLFHADALRGVRLPVIAEEFEPSPASFGELTQIIGALGGAITTVEAELERDTVPQIMEHNTPATKAKGKTVTAPKKKFGRPRKRPAGEDEKIADEWQRDKARGRTRKEFVEHLRTRTGSHVTSVKDLDNVLTLVRKRRQKQEALRVGH